jgi:hypothetical protein
MRCPDLLNVSICLEAEEDITMGAQYTDQHKRHIRLPGQMAGTVQSNHITQQQQVVFRLSVVVGG